MEAVGTILRLSHLTEAKYTKTEVTKMRFASILLALWSALLFVSGGAAIGTTVVSRRKKYDR